MKKIFRKLSVILTVILITSLLCSCGNSEEKKTIKIGATGPLTGSTAVYGTSVNNGATLAIEEINKAGGLDGITFSFEMKDDQADPADAASGYDALYDDGMQISLGSVTSGACEAFAKRADKDRVFVLTPSASSDTVISIGSSIFRLCFGDPDQGILAAETLSEKYTKIGCIYDNSDDYSSGIYEAFAGKMKELNKEIEVRTFDSDTNKDFSSQVEALSGCEVIFLPIYYTEASLIVRKCTEKGLNDIVLFGCDGLDGLADLLDDSVKNKISYITPFNVHGTDTKTASFVNSYKEKYGAEPDQFAADGYDCIYSIFNALKKGEMKDASASAKDFCEKLIAVFTSSDFSYEGVTGTMSWNDTGACEKEPVIVEID